MKVTNLVVHVLSASLDQSFAFSQGWVNERNALIVEVHTDEGIIGWGESLCHGLQPPQVAAAIVEHSLKPLIVGQDPFDVEVLWERMYNHTRPYGQFGAVINAMSSVDIALWDILGKALNKPVSKLMGGTYRSEVTPYATGFYRLKGEAYPQAATKEARRHMEHGFKAMKLKIGFGIEEDIEYIMAVRQAVGPDITLMADANCAYNAATARKILLEVESAKLYWFEEPLAPEDIEGYKHLKGITATYMAAGENLFGPIGYRDWVSQQALDILQPDLCSAGGFTACKKISALANTWNTMINPHVWGSGICLAASLQYLATIPPTPLSLNPIEPMLEYDQSSHPFRQDLICHEIQMREDGKVEIPLKAGIGVNVNRDVLDEYKIN